MHRTVFGHDPVGGWAAPGRVNLIGEHTDYNNGYVLPFALPRRTTVTAGPVDAAGWTVHSAEAGETVTFGPGDLTPGAVPGWAGYVAGVVWALREAGLPVPGARLAVTSDVPQGAGLSSSAALECAVLTALVDLGGLVLTLPERAAVARQAENGYVGMPCGIMDQSASIMCRAGHALFLDCRSGRIEHVPLELARYGLTILMIDTRAAHRLVTGGYAARRAACEHGARSLGLPSLREVTDPPARAADRAPMGLDRALARLGDDVVRRRVRHVVTENQRVLQTVALLRAGQVPRIGPLLTASHNSLRDDFEVSTPELDTAVTAAVEAGAYGARMTGAGFGGCALALVDADRTAAVASAVTRAFARSGFREPALSTAEPAGGAARCG